MDQAKGALRALIRRRRADRAGAAGWEQVRQAEGSALCDAAAGAGLLDPRGRADAVGPVTIAAYVASPTEPEVAAIRAAVRGAGGRVLLPIPRPGRQLAWAEDDGCYAEVGRLRVLAPTGPPVGGGAGCLLAEGVRLLLVPALAVDLCGTRLGQGGGYYDVLLADLDGRSRAPAIEAGGPPLPVVVVRDDEVLPAGTIPRDRHDIAVGVALTPSGLRRLG